MLEEQGLLAHPHTSAGRVPTDAGYRYFVDRLLPAEPRSAATVELSLVRREVDDAMRAATETLSQLTNLMAIVSAPPIQTATVRHVEVLLLQPQVLMVVVITSTGGVSKRVFTFERAGRPRPRRAGPPPTSTSSSPAARSARARCAPASPTPRCPRPSARSSRRSRPPSPSSRRRPRRRCTSTAPTACRRGRLGDVSQLHELMEVVERRAVLLGALQAALSTREVYVRIGAENDLPALRSMSMVAANYGLPSRNLGTVSVIGPTRMDYGGDDRHRPRRRRRAVALRRRRLGRDG